MDSEHSPGMIALFTKFPSLKRAVETGVESHDGREEALLSFVKSHPNFSQMKGNPTAVLSAIDEFSFNHDFLISIGAHKSEIISSLVEKEKPKVLVELGGYLGYSAILFADTMRRANSTQKDLRVWSLEMSPEFAAIAREIIDIAGLGYLVTVVVGPAEKSLRNLKNEGRLLSCDMLFLDHVEDLYLTDFKVCEELELLKPGAVVVADNVVRPGAPEYRAFVRSHDGLRSEGVRGLIQPGDIEDELEISYVK